MGLSPLFALKSVALQYANLCAKHLTRLVNLQSIFDVLVTNFNKYWFSTAIGGCCNAIKLLPWLKQLLYAGFKHGT
jgi:hypothetical protein